ncbi:MAG TPA: UvrD-helicase domain-containing protein [Candidatus Saccharimonadales bacterium]|nr:UvrD-helicase domain-containing protein [Candidatus Saccharimonadales bacterium]
MAEPIVNSEQQTAITHGEGPLLIIAGAGTGKTTVVTERIKYLILEKKINPANILALTFTEKAATEMEERIDIAMPYGYTQMWIATFHAFCDRVLRNESIHIGLNPAYKLMTEAESVMFLRKHLYKLNLQYFRPLGNPYKFIQGLLQHFSRLKDEDLTPEAYLAYASNLPVGRDKADELERKKTTELANAYKTYEELKMKEGMMDFSDMIANTLKLFRTRPNLLKQYQEQFEYILIDEFQDTNFAQNQLAILLSGEKKNITVVGDDDQCLPGNTLVTTVSGLKKIKDIKKNEKIITAVGKGLLSSSTVTKTFHKKKKTIFLTIKTKSGYTVTATYNHKMFCYIPKHGTQKQWYYVYLMFRKNLGWRIGITNDLVTRLKLERSSDAIIGLRAFQTEDEARYHELLWSLQYQIPACIFKERDGIVMQGEYVQKLYKQFNTEENAKKLAEDLGIDLSKYHHVLDAVTRGQSKRIKIHYSLCFRQYRSKRKEGYIKDPLIRHEVRLETSNEIMIQKLQKATISYQKAKKGIRIRQQFSDAREADRFAQELVAITDGFIEEKAALATFNKVNTFSLIMPAGNLLEGLYVPVVKDNNRAYYDEIISIERKGDTQDVYDLEVDKTHNFIANGIIVHNSIYAFRGSSVSNMMQFRTQFPEVKIVSLTKNYRSTANVLDSSYQLIQFNNPDRLEIKENIDKKLVAMRNTSGSPVDLLFADRVENEAELVIKKIKELSKKGKYQYKDFAILVRANDHSQPFIRSLERNQIPYQFLGPGQLFHQEEIKDIIAYLKVLYNFEDNASLYRVLSMPIFDVTARDIAAMLNYSKKKNLTLFEVLEQITEVAVPDTTKEKIEKITKMIRQHMSRISKDTAGQILYYFLENTGMMQTFVNPTNIHEEKVTQNIAKFFDKLKTYEGQHDDASVFAVVDWIDLSMQMGESPLAADVDWLENNAVNILTIHSSKGLEFPVVFVTNAVTQRFPSRERREQIPIPQDLIKEILPEGDFHLQEERRLFYVAMTRARDYLFITAANFYGEGKRERKISPFVIEALGEDFIKLRKTASAMQGTQLSLLDMFTSVPEEMSIDTSLTKPRITYLSYSQIQTFDMCPLHYKLRYLLKVPSETTSSLTFGTSVHAALKTFYERHIFKDPIAIDRIDEILRANWSNEGYTSKAHEQEAFTQAVAVLKNYLHTHFNPDNLPIAVETPFIFPIKGLKAGGRIDRIDKLPDGRIEIIDYKTGANMPTERELLTNFQLTLYALAANQVHDAILNRKPEDIVLSLHYVEQDTILSTTRTQEQLEEAKETLLQKADQIANSEFLCNKNMFCLNCEYKMLCNAH